MSLKVLKIRDEYRSDSCNLIQDFYIPCLERSVIYSRAVGFFSSTALAAAARGILALIRSGGKMQLIASPYLSQEDAEAITQGFQQREDRITAVLQRELEQAFDQIVSDRLGCLAWLLEQGLLEIKLAVPRAPYQQALYHEKLGLFTDEEGNVVAFMGSANESSMALIDNFECIDVYWSWDPVLCRRALAKVDHFQRLWNNQTSRLDVIEFPEAAKRALLKLRPQHLPLQDPELLWQSYFRSKEVDEDYADTVSQASSSGIPQCPQWLTLRPYQEQAIANWFANRGMGTLKMATGSGKTITALALASELYRKSLEQNKPLQGLLIICPYRHLVTQWAREARKFGLRPILAYDKVQSWQGELQSQLLSVLSGSQEFITVITTNATFIRDSLQSQLQFFSKAIAHHWR